MHKQRVFDSDIYFSMFSGLELLFMDRRSKVLGAVHPEYGRVLIRIYPGYWRGPACVEEQRSYAELNCVPHVYENGILLCGGRRCFYGVEERTRGLSLRELGERDGGLSVKLALHIFPAGLRSLCEFERAGLTHGYIGRGNILVGMEETKVNEETPGVSFPEPWVSFAEPGIGPRGSFPDSRRSDVGSFASAVYESLDCRERMAPEAFFFMRLLWYVMEGNEQSPREALLRLCSCKGTSQLQRSCPGIV